MIDEKTNTLNAWMSSVHFYSTFKKVTKHSSSEKLHIQYELFI
jgi:hypothetical protein